MLHPQLLSELEELLRQKGLLENDPQSEIVPKAPVFRGAAPSMPLACPNCEEDDTLHILTTSSVFLTIAKRTRDGNWNSLSLTS